MKRFLTFAIILLLLIPAFTMADKKYEEEEILLNILEEVGGDFIEGDLNMGGVILDEFSNISTMKDLSEKIKTTLGITEIQLDESEEDLIIEEEGFNQVTLYGNDEKQNMITLILTSYLDSKGINGETTLFINLIKNQQNFKLNDIIDKVENIFENFGRTVDTTTCIIGTIEGRLDSREIEDNAIRSIKRSKGNIVEEYQDSSLLSFTAYTPLVDRYIYSGDKKINLNLAVRYNENEGKTYIWIGTPIITIGY